MQHAPTAKNSLKVDRLPEFDRDLKRLRKRFRTLADDLTNFINTAVRLYHEQGVPIEGIFRIAGLKFDYPIAYVSKRFASKALKGTSSQSGIRVVYVHFKKEDRIELVEIYYKGDQDVEDKERLNRHYATR